MSPAEQRFNDALAIVAEYADLDLTYLARAVTKLRPDAITSVLNRLEQDVLTGPPALSAVQALEVSLFDNWGCEKKPTKNSGPRWAVKIEAWINAAGPIFGGGNKKRNSAYRATATLYDQAEFVAKAREYGSEKRKRPWRATSPTDSDGSALAAFADDLAGILCDNEGARVGPLCMAMGKGKSYHPGAFVMAADVGEPDMMLLLALPESEPLVITGWRTTYPDGKPLAGSCILQARASKRNEDIHWRTTKL